MRGGLSVGLVKCRNTHYEVQVDTKKRKKKGGEEVEEPVFERFWLQTPIGYCVRALRNKLRNLVKPIVRGERKKVEIVLERWPQVNTVMGEINAGLPKDKRLRFGYTTNEEENTLFVIERA